MWCWVINSVPFWGYFYESSSSSGPHDIPMTCINTCFVLLTHKIWIPGLIPTIDNSEFPRTVLSWSSEHVHIFAPLQGQVRHVLPLGFQKKKLLQFLTYHMLDANMFVLQGFRGHDGNIRHKLHSYIIIFYCKNLYNLYPGASPYNTWHFKNFQRCLWCWVLPSVSNVF